MKRLIPIILILILIIIIQHLARSIQTLMTNQQSVQDLQQQTKQEKQNNQYLSQQLQYVKQNQFIEQEAREKLGMVKKDEVVVIIPSPTSFPLPTHTEANELNWVKWWKIIF